MMNQGTYSPRATIEEKIGMLSDAGHEFALTTIGLIAMGAEESQRLWRQRAAVLEAAQTRGGEVETDAIQKVRDVEQKVTDAFHQLRKARQSRPCPSQMVNFVARRFRDRFDEHLAKSCIKPVESAWQEINITVAEPDEALQSESKSASVLPFSDYDAMTAKEIIAQLNTLDVEQLNIVDMYERTHANRVTIVRAIERQLKAR